MTKDQAIELARSHALRAGADDLHAYLPRTAEEAALWDPHEWVVGAIRESGEETWWLLESKFAAPQPSWWNGLPEGNGPAFTRDPNQAVRFARREDAARVAKHMHMVELTEHKWINDPDLGGRTAHGIGA